MSSRAWGSERWISAHPAAANKISASRALATQQERGNRMSCPYGASGIFQSWPRITLTSTALVGSAELTMVVTPKVFLSQATV